jgi:hypothetical protein
MDSAHRDTSRTLMRIAMLLFILTIVIGILNGTDLWNPDRNTLLTHVHSGTLGWLSLATVGGALLIFGSGSSPRDVRTTRLMALLLAVTIILYVAAFWSGTGIQRPIAGSLVFVTMLWVLGWSIRRMRTEATTTPRFAMVFAFVSMVIGAIFGLILGLVIAGRSVPGISGTAAGRIADAHPGSMVIGFLVLSGLALAEWLLRDEQQPLTAWGIAQVLVVFVAGASLIVGMLADSDQLLTLNVPLEVVGIVIFVARLRKELRPGRWSRGRSGPLAPVAVMALILSVVLLGYVVSRIVGGAEFTDILPYLLALDHITFIGVMTNLLFGLAITVAGGWDGSLTDRLIVWGVNLGLATFAVGLITESPALKRIGTPLMGAALLLGIWTFFKALSRKDVAA